MECECGELVRAARQGAGLSVRALAAQVRKADGSSITASYVTDIEKGRGIPMAPVAESLAAVLEIDATRLLAACDRDRERRSV